MSNAIPKQRPRTPKPPQVISETVFKSGQKLRYIGDPKIKFGVWQCNPAQYRDFEITDILQKSVSELTQKLRPGCVWARVKCHGTAPGRSGCAWIDILDPSEWHIIGSC